MVTPRYAAEGVRGVGMTRKLISTCSAGLVDFRSDKERIARSTRQTAHGIREQNRQARPQRGVPVLASAPAAPAGAWLPDPSGAAGLLRWWDGWQWTSATAVVTTS